MEAFNVMSLGVATITADASIEQAHALMLKLGIRHLPVLARKKVVGVLSVRDVLLSAGRGGADFSYPKLAVSELMSSAPVTEGINTPIAALARLMLEHKIDAVPIVSAENELVGLVTSSDLLRTVRAVPDALSLQLARPTGRRAQPGAR